MILIKLQEALAEVAVQRVALNEVEAQLRSMIAKLSGMPVIPQVAPLAVKGPAAPMRDGARDKIDDMVDILRAEGKPLHITVLAERLSALKGAEVLRTTIEPGINRHVSKVKMRRIDKFAPSTFGLPEWKETSPQQRLTDVA
jgi:hypothetical protein